MYRAVLSSLDSFCVQAGDKVVYSKYAGTEVALDGSDYVLLKVTLGAVLGSGSSLTDIPAVLPACGMQES